MDKIETQELFKRQKAYFRSGATRSYEFRLRQLKKLQQAVRDNEDLICEAMMADMNKAPYEVYMTETGMVLEEVRYHIKHLKSWMKDRKVTSPLSQFPSKSWVSPEPIGTVLIMSPWNYPVQLCLEPLIGAISAGCTVMIKPSSYAPNTSHALKKILSDIYPEEYIGVVEGGRAENTELLKMPYDHIFFTGSKGVGQVVLHAAAEHLTPCTLELGGKSPAIVHKDADLKTAARRLAFGKVLNAGQTCVEPDYLLIHQDVKDAFVEEFKNALDEFFPDGDMSDMNVIINEKHFKRISEYLKDGKVLVGGGTDPERRFIEPTLLDEVGVDAPIMQDEIFGPILPILTYTEIDSCIDYILDNPKPLALYLFTNDKKLEKKVLGRCSFGGGCINDTIVHLASTQMGFGGVGASGMGSYHGKLSFDTFTHYRSMLKKANWLDLPVRYRPYTGCKDKLLRFFMH